MELSTFIKQLVTEGKVIVNGTLIQFSENDLQATKGLLQAYYNEDKLEMALAAPDFSEEAALWAAQYFYQAVQLTINRDAGEEIVATHLPAFTGDITVETIYSADLALRYLPALFELAKGLAPGDILVTELRKTAAKWPFSSVGIELKEKVSDELIFTHASLKQAYIDRIINKKDNSRIDNEEILDCLIETTGEHLATIWPEFKTDLKQTHHESSVGKTI